MNPTEWAGEERRRYTPVDLRHMGWGPRVALIGLMVTLIVNIIITSMSYQRLVSQTNVNTNRIEEIRGVDVELMRMMNDMTRAMASLTSTVNHLAEDVRRVERQVE